MKKLLIATATVLSLSACAGMETERALVESPANPPNAVVAEVPGYWRMADGTLWPMGYAQDPRGEVVYREQATVLPQGEHPLKYGMQEGMFTDLPREPAAGFR